MAPPPENDPFFSPDWREQVREFLAPFKDEDEEIENEYWFNVVREQADRSRAHVQSTLRFGDVFLEREHMQKRTIIYARKSVFSAILQFWAYASLAYNAPDYSGARICIWFDWSERHSQSLNPIDFKAGIEEQWPVEKYPLPAVQEETMLRAWQYSPKWYEWFAIAEISDSFVFWCKRVGE